MQINHKHTIFGSLVAFILAFSCCWLPLLIVGLGSAAGMASFSEGLEQYSGLLMVLGSSLLLFGVYQMIQRGMKSKVSFEVITSSIITCPNCDFSKKEQMPTNACQYFYECESCKELIKPKQGDCCVYCSYGSVPCPPIQNGDNCC